MTNEEPTVVPTSNEGEAPDQNIDGQPPKPAKISYSPEQQAHFDRCIKDAHRNLREHNRALDAELKLVRAKLLEQPTGETATLELEVQRLKGELEGSTRRTAIERAAAESNCFAPDILTGLLASRTSFDPKLGFVVKDPDDADAPAVPLKDAVSKLETERPYLFKSTLRGGTGASQAKGYAKERYPIADIFGPKSNGRLASQFAREDKPGYTKMKLEARRRGLI